MDDETRVRFRACVNSHMVHRTSKNKVAIVNLKNNICCVSLPPACPQKHDKHLAHLFTCRGRQGHEVGK